IPSQWCWGGSTCWAATTSTAPRSWRGACSCSSRWCRSCTSSPAATSGRSGLLLGHPDVMARRGDGELSTSHADGGDVLAERQRGGRDRDRALAAEDDAADGVQQRVAGVELG